MAARMVGIALVAVGEPAEAEGLCQDLTSRGWQILSPYNGAAALAASCSEPVLLLVVRADLVVERALRPRAGIPALHPLSLQSLAAFLQTVGEPRVGQTAPAAPPRIALGTRVELWSETGALSAGCTASITEVAPTFLRAASEACAESLGHVSLGAPLRVSFPSSRGRVEVMARVAGLSAGASRSEVTLSLSEPVRHCQRRRAPRLEAHLPVRAWPAAHPDRAGAMVSGLLADIGEGGLAAGFLAPLPAARHVVLAIDAGEEGELRARARVAWHQPPAGFLVTDRYGFQFVEPPRGARAKLQALIARLDPALASALSPTSARPFFRKRSPPRPTTAMGCRNRHAHFPTS